MPNFGRDKRRIEETKRKRREEKRLKKLNKNMNPPPEGGPAPETLPGETPPDPSSSAS